MELDPITDPLVQDSLCASCYLRQGEILAEETLLCSLCPIRIHLLCLGSNASYDESNNFICPFCAYQVSKQKHTRVADKLKSYIGSSRAHTSGDSNDRKSRGKCVVRRKPVTWTDLEVETLTELVGRYAETGKSIPWSTILKLGGSKFSAVRRPTDLKDKWRRMCFRS